MLKAEKGMVDATNVPTLHKNNVEF